MLFAAYIGAFLGSVLILAAFSYVLPRLLREPRPIVDGYPLSRTSQSIVAPKAAAAASDPVWVGLTLSDVVDGATLYQRSDVLTAGQRERAPPLVRRDPIGMCQHVCRLM